MALIVEDGSGVANANSYVTLVEARAYAADRGIVLSPDDTVLAPLVIKAADYVESKASLFVGNMVDPDQAMAWPRENVSKSDGTPFPTNEIPVKLKQAQSQCVIEEVNGIDLNPTFKGIKIKREKVDVIETEYSDTKYSSTTIGQPIMPKVDALLESLLINGGLGLRVIRA